MNTHFATHPTGALHSVHGFEAIQEFEHDTGLVEGIGYWNGRLVRYTAGSAHSSPFECETIGVGEALHWWAQLEIDQSTDSSVWADEARARFLEAASRCVGPQEPVAGL